MKVVLIGAVVAAFAVVAAGRDLGEPGEAPEL
jgi:hypothetical protein